MRLFFRWLSVVPVRDSDRSWSSIGSAHVPDYPELSALARLGHKYQIDALEKHATDHLKTAFTNNVEQFERQLASPSYSNHNPVDIIHIGRLTNNPSMLPLAFWLCAQNEDTIIDGQAREDGTQLVLDKTDAKRCVVGICELCRMSERTIEQTLQAVPHPFCGSPTACRVAWDSWAVGLKTSGSGPQGSRDIHLLKGLPVYSVSTLSSSWAKGGMHDATHVLE